MEIETEDLRGITAELELSASLPIAYRRSRRSFDIFPPPEDPPEVEFKRLTLRVPWSNEAIVIEDERKAREIISPEAWEAAEDEEIENELEDEAI